MISLVVPITGQFTGSILIDFISLKQMLILTYKQ
jgi:hypothetical protein